MKALTQSDKNILLNQYMGEKPRRMWRVWYNKERDFGAICIRTLEEAKLTAERELRWFNEWEEPAENFFISEPEEYDDWSHAVNYFGDYNACHELEETLFKRGDWSACVYEEILQKMTTSWAWHATEKQRAEAAGQTLKLW